MSKVTTSFSLLAALLFAGAQAQSATGATAATPPASSESVRPPGLAGRVKGETTPLRAAGVYAYQIADSSLHRVVTDQNGSFLFQDLPAGLYKIIAHKSGFAPVVVLLTRSTAQAYQFLELQLAEQEAAGAAPSGQPGDDFWAIRGRIPADVLREIERDEAPATAVFLPSGGIEGLLTPLQSGVRIPAAALQAAGFRTEMQALTGVDQIAGGAGEGFVSGGRVGIIGQLGQTRVNLHGKFQQLEQGSTFADQAYPGAGQSRAVTLDVAHGTGGRLQLASLNNRLDRLTLDGGGPIDFEQYRVNYTQPFGDDSRSDFSAQYTAESNFHRQDPRDPEQIPEASRTWRVEGAYTTTLGSRSTLQAGLRYRERAFGLDTAAQPVVREPQSSLDLFGRGGVRLEPAVLLEYGLYSTLSDGSLAITPQGGLVLQLGKTWQLSGSVSRKVYDEVADDGRIDFLPVLYQESDLCQEGSASCYQVGVTHEGENDTAFSLNAVHRRVGETLRLYFSDDFFDRFESLYLVPGDEIPEMRMSISHRLAPTVLATLASSMASGGGGMFLTADQQPYENSVRYVVTSLDTQFRGTSTGVFVAFHHLSQELEPVAWNAGVSSQTDLERLQLLLTQDLNVLFNLAADWAVQLNMEVSRAGASQDHAGTLNDDLRKRFLGGIAVRF